MATQAFDARVEGITGLTISSSGTTPTEAELTEFLKDGVIEVTNMFIALKPEIANEFIRSSSESTSNGGVSIESAKILHVVREAGTDNDWRDCNQVDLGMQSRVTDPTSLDYASKYHPVFSMSTDGAVFVFPAPSPGGANSYKVYYVNGTPINSSDSSLIFSHTDIGAFPEDKVYLVVLYASIKSLEAKMAEFAIDEEDPELVAGLQANLIALKEQYQMAFGVNAPKEGER